MSATHGKIRCGRRRSAAGLGMIELLVALAIASTLLLATAMAFHASFQSMEANSALAESSQMARVLLHQMTIEVRRSLGLMSDADLATYGDSGEDIVQFGLIPQDNPNLAAQDQPVFILYIWNSIDKTLSLRQILADETVTDAVLSAPPADIQIGTWQRVYVDNFEAFDVVGTVATVELVISVVAVQGDGGNETVRETITLTDGATPRRDFYNED